MSENRQYIDTIEENDELNVLFDELEEDWKMYIIIALIMLIMAGAILCACFKPGEKENICKYGQGDGKQWNIT
jgi:hypothetical protein